MRLLSLTALVFISTSPLMAAEPITGAQKLGGYWMVDLSVKADEPYNQQMRLTLNADGTVAGLF